MLLSKNHTLAIIASASEGGNAQLWRWALEDKYLLLETEYYSMDNSSHILVRAVLIKNYNYICARVIPSMLGNWFTWSLSSVLAMTDKTYTLLLYTLIFRFISVSVDIKMTPSSLNQACCAFTGSWLYFRIPFVPFFHTSQDDTIACHPIMFYVVRAPKIERLTGKVISFFFKIIMILLLCNVNVKGDKGI